MITIKQKDKKGEVNFEMVTVTRIPAVIENALESGQYSWERT